MKRLALKIIDLLSGTPLGPPTPREVVLAQELEKQVRDLPGVFSATDAWMAYQARIRDMILADDPRRFLRWNVVLETMFVVYGRFSLPALFYLRNLPDWSERWQGAVRESPVGSPLPLVFYPKSSGTLIQHAYHLAKFEEMTGQRIDNLDFVLEFGGGYGSMCRLFHNLGFRGKYVIFDLPLLSALQKYYLAQHGITVGDLTTRGTVSCVSELEDLRSVLDGGAAPSLFLATWSISETLLEFRNSFLPLVTGFDSFCFSYQREFEHVDNIAFFSQWKSTLGTHMRWYESQIKHYPGNYHLFGVTTCPRRSVHQ